MDIQKKVTSFQSTTLGKNAAEVRTTKELQVVETDGTLVTASLGTTLSQNYNSVRCDVGISWPTTKARHEADFKKAWEIVGKQLNDQLVDAKEFLRRLK